MERTGGIPHVGKNTNTLNNAPKQIAETSMWVAFEHVLMFISLYVLMISLGLILNRFIDIWIPEASRVAYSSLDQSEELDRVFLRANLAALLVSWPLFSFFFIHINRALKRNPHLKGLKSRKFLIYFTLVVNFVVMIAQLVKIIYNFLGGNITLNFVSHFFVTVVLSGVVFAYYLHQVTEDRKSLASNQ